MTATSENSNGKKRRSDHDVSAFFAWRKSWMQALRRHPDTKSTPRLFILADILSEAFDWKRRDCFVGRERLADELGVNVRSISTLTAKLVAMGFIQIKRRGPKTSSLYVGMMPAEVQSASHQQDGEMCSPTSLDVQSSDTKMGSQQHTNVALNAQPERKGARSSAHPQAHSYSSISSTSPSARLNAPPTGPTHEDNTLSTGSANHSSRDDDQLGQREDTDVRDDPIFVWIDENPHVKSTARTRTPQVAAERWCSAAGKFLGVNEDAGQERLLAALTLLGEPPDDDTSDNFEIEATELASDIASTATQSRFAKTAGR